MRRRAIHLMALWSLDRPPLLERDFPGDRNAGERARDEFYRRWFASDESELARWPPYDPEEADDEVRHQQLKARAAPWKRLLRQYHDRHARQRTHEDDAARKRQKRYETAVLAAHGDAVAKERMDGEMERGRHRREQARVAAAEARQAAEGARELREQRGLVHQFRAEALRCLLKSRREVTCSPGMVPRCAIFDNADLAYWAENDPPDGSQRWRSRAKRRPQPAAFCEARHIVWALFKWDKLFNPNFLEARHSDDHGYYEAPYKRVRHPWLDRHVSMPAPLILWLQHLLDTTTSLPARRGAHQISTERDQLDEEENRLITLIDANEQHDWEDDLQLLPLQVCADLPPPARTASAAQNAKDKRWFQLSRAEKAAARLLSFNFHSWHRKVAHAPWSELCDVECAAASQLGFERLTWDSRLPPASAMEPVTAAQADAARLWLQSQLELTRSLEIKFKQVWQHPSFRTNMRDVQILPPQLQLYDVTGEVSMPPFVRTFAMRRSPANPQGYCREHAAVRAPPIGWTTEHPPPWTLHDCCDCTVGAPGLEPCNICGFPSSSEHYCSMADGTGACASIRSIVHELREAVALNAYFGDTLLESYRSSSGACMATFDGFMCYTRSDPALRRLLPERTQRQHLEWRKRKELLSTAPKVGWSRCNLCGDYGHQRETCLISVNQAVGMYGAIFCNVCNKHGHLPRACRLQCDDASRSDDEYP